MAQFHFVEDYEKLIKWLIKKYPMDEAMSIAVGGNYELIGQIEAQLLLKLGLADGMRIVDLGCGSGRLPSALHKTVNVSYVGIDIVKALLHYAKSKVPSYEFMLHQELSIPQQDDSVDVVSAFSLFTHLLHAESYIYLEECMRVLKPGGKVVFSFLEFAEPTHWQIFYETKVQTREGKLPHLNSFIERSVIETWSMKLGLTVEQFISARTPIWKDHVFGQSVVVLKKPIQEI